MDISLKMRLKFWQNQIAVSNPTRQLALSQRVKHSENKSTWKGDIVLQALHNYGKPAVTSDHNA